MTKYAKRVMVEHDSAKFDIDFSFRDFVATIPSKSDSIYSMQEYSCMQSQVVTLFKDTTRNKRLL